MNWSAEPALHRSDHYHILVSDDGGFPHTNYVFYNGPESVKAYLDVISSIFPKQTEFSGRAATESAMYDFAKDDEAGEGVLYKRGNFVVAWVLCDACVAYSLN